MIRNQSNANVDLYANVEWRPYYLMVKVKLELEKQLGAGIIRKSNSPWCSPIK